MIERPAPGPPKGWRPRPPNKTEKLEAALRAAGFKPDDRIEWDHDPPLHLRVWIPERGDTDPPANDPAHLVPRSKQAHREKTARQDVPAIAKTRRLAREQEDFRRRMLAKAGSEEAVEPEPKTKRKRAWPSRPFPKKGGIS